MPKYVMEEGANALNDRLVAFKDTKAALVVGDKIDSLRGPGNMFLGVSGKIL